MKKNPTISRLIVWLLTVTFMLNTPTPVYSMARIKTKAMDIKKKNAITRLVRAFKDTRELRRKKAAGTATPEELKELDRRMSNIKKGAIAVGVTLAIIAAIAGGTAIGRYFYKKDKAQNELLEAVKTGDTQTVKQLLKEGVRVSDYYDDPLKIAVEKGHIEIVRLLLQYQTYDQQYMETMINEARSKNNIPIAKLLFNHYQTQEKKRLYHIFENL